LAHVLLSTRAGDGLIRIRDSVESQHGSVIAERVLKRLGNAFEMLAEHPLVGHRRRDVTTDPRIRFWTVPPTLIAYRAIEPNKIEVVAVERGELDWSRLFDDRSD